jgi:hypothetical protein
MDRDRGDSSVERAWESGITRFFEYIPQIIGALVILVIGYFISKIIAGIVRRVLQKLRFDRALHTSPAGRYIDRMVESPTSFIGKVVFWIIFFGFISLAVAALDLPVLNNLLEGIYSYIPNIVAAIIIFLVASAISAGSAAFALRVMGKTPTARLISTVIPAITMGIAVFMILNQLRIAPEIVNITYTAIMGAMALGLALAFGLGGRDVARTILEQAYEASRRNADTVKRDMSVAKRNAKAKASELEQ